VAAVCEVSIIILSVLSNNGSKDLVCSIMMMSLQLTTFRCDDNKKLLLCVGATLCFLCDLELSQTCIICSLAYCTGGMSWS
jgi:hypothetical protein